MVSGENQETKTHYNSKVFIYVVVMGKYNFHSWKVHLSCFNILYLIKMLLIVKIINDIFVYIIWCLSIPYLEQKLTSLSIMVEDHQQFGLKVSHAIELVVCCLCLAMHQSLNKFTSMIQKMNYKIDYML